MGHSQFKVTLQLHRVRYISLFLYIYIHIHTEYQYGHFDGKINSEWAELWRGKLGPRIEHVQYNKFDYCL